MNHFGDYNPEDFDNFKVRMENIPPEIKKHTPEQGPEALEKREQLATDGD